MLNSQLDLGDSNDECINEDYFDCDYNMSAISEDWKSEFLNNITLFCVKLQAKILLSASMIQNIMP